MMYLICLNNSCNYAINLSIGHPFEDRPEVKQFIPKKKAHSTYTKLKRIRFIDYSPIKKGVPVLVFYKLIHAHTPSGTKPPQQRPFQYCVSSEFN